MVLVCRLLVTDISPSPQKRYRSRRCDDAGGQAVENPLTPHHYHHHHQKSGMTHQSHPNLSRTSYLPARPNRSRIHPPCAVAAQGKRTRTRIKVDRIPLRISGGLRESQNAIASSTAFNKVDMSSLMETHAKDKVETLDDYDVNLGFMSAFARPSILAPEEIPHRMRASRPTRLSNALIST